MRGPCPLTWLKNENPLLCSERSELARAGSSIVLVKEKRPSFLAMLATL
jgi:hypothetical protein